MSDLGPTTELRCALRYDSALGELILDAEVLTRSDSGWTSEILTRQKAIWSSAPRPQPSPEAARINEVMRSWLEPGSYVDGDRDPSGLPDADIAGAWGSYIAGLLVEGLGRETLEGILKPQPLRLVFESADGFVDRIPFETMVWPPEATNQPLVQRPVVSLLRSHWVTDPAEQALREPGLFRTLIATTSEQEVVAAFAGMSLPAGASDGVLSLGQIEQPQRRTLAHDLEQLEHAMATGAPDLVILAGHGVPQQHGGAAGLKLGTTVTTVDQIARALAPRPAIAVLAMCGSATPALSQGNSAATALALHGIPITIGFQGETTPRLPTAEFARVFLETLGEELREPVTSGTTRWDITAVERAVSAGRKAMGHAALLPVVTVHPSALAARTPTSRRGRRISPDSLRVRSARATPWYVPGQVARWTLDGQDVRIPLPVDVGRTLIVTLDDAPLFHSGGSDPALDSDRLEKLATLWGLAYGISVECVGSPAPEGWETTSAELSAVIRSIAYLLRLRTPPGVLELLHSEVADGWGAHDAAPRIVETTTGRPLGRLPAFPDLVVEAEEIPSRQPPRPTLRDLDAAQIAQRLRAAFTKDGRKAFTQLVGYQWPAGSELSWVVSFPSLARITEEREMTEGTGPVVLEDIVPGLAPDVPNELR